MRWAHCAVLVLSACYAPKVVGGVPCDLQDPRCPNGQACVATSGGAFCRSDGPDVDGGIDSAIDGGNCLGKGLLGSVCLSGAMPAPVALTSTATITTTSNAAGNCREIRPQAGGPPLCLVIGSTINIATGVTVRAIGPNPLVLVATQSITIAGTIDVSSHAGETIGGNPVLGAGARTATECAAIGIDGLPGKLVNNDDYGGGGAAGGSFGAIGGAGGTGGNNGNIGRGNPVAAGAATVLVGGCPGGHGGEGSGGGGGGIGGNAGGAVFLLAGDSITVTGKINASGSGGKEGIDGMFSSGGAGGGGSGGLIGVEAARIMATGSIFANGGGGGGGGGGQPANHGTAGADPTVPLTAASGGTGGSGGGGGGGTGSIGATAGVAGKNASNNTQSAGGGGGGGAGVIRVYGVPPASLGGQVSPPAS